MKQFVRSAPFVYPPLPPLPLIPSPQACVSEGDPRCDAPLVGQYVSKSSVLCRYLNVRQSGDEHRTHVYMEPHFTPLVSNDGGVGGKVGREETIKLGEIKEAAMSETTSGRLLVMHANTICCCLSLRSHPSRLHLTFPESVVWLPSEGALPDLLLFFLSLCLNLLSPVSCDPATPRIVSSTIRTADEEERA